MANSFLVNQFLNFRRVSLCLNGAFKCVSRPMPGIDPNKPTEKLEGFTLHCDKGQDLSAQPDAHA
jgi:hypothetical protein